MKENVRTTDLSQWTVHNERLHPRCVFPISQDINHRTTSTPLTRSNNRTRQNKNKANTISPKTGDKVAVHYRGSLAADGKEFDASYNRGQPLTFHVGKGQVIKGWDQGLLDMCPGEARKLTIQPEWAYGDRGMGPIPAKSVLSKFFLIIHESFCWVVWSAFVGRVWLIVWSSF